MFFNSIFCLFVVYTKRVLFFRVPRMVMQEDPELIATPKLQLFTKKLLMRKMATYKKRASTTKEGTTTK